MRKPIVAGNWKMNKTVAEARDLVNTMKPPLQAVMNVEKVLCPPYMALMAVASLLEGSDIGVISTQLGHSSITTTAKYLDHIAPAAVIDTMRARTW